MAGDATAAGVREPSLRAALSFTECDDELCGTPVVLKASHIIARRMTVRLAKLQYTGCVRHVLLLKKWHDAESAAVLQALEHFLRSEMPTLSLSVAVDGDSADFDSVDLVVCVGGDGTVLHCASMCPGPMPPLMSVSAGGSLSFLTSFRSDDAPAVLRRLVLDTPVAPFFEVCAGGGGAADCACLCADVCFQVSLRMRLRARLFRAGCSVPEAEYSALNEVLLGRGSSPFLTQFDAAVDGVPLTKVQADGIIIATPTGSTAYNLSAGGPICMPTVPAMLFTPVCPHSLSFRPLLLPDSSRVRLSIPAGSRGTAVMNADGKNQVELRCGDWLEVDMSDFPVPLVTNVSTSADFVLGLTDKLHWNLREAQKPLLYCVGADHAPVISPSA